MSKFKKVLSGTINKNNKIVLGPLNCWPVLRDGFRDYFKDSNKHRVDNFISSCIAHILSNFMYNFQGYFRGLIKNGIDNFIDIYTFNPYFSGSYVSFNNSKKYQIKRLKWIVDAFLRIYKENELKKPIWISEIGIFDKWVNLTSKEIGEVYIEMFNFAAENNIKKMFVWNFLDFVDDCYSRWNPEISSGVVKNNLEPKESFKVLKNFFNSKK